MLKFNFYVIICLGDNMDSTNYPLGRKIPFDLFKDKLIKGQYMYENNFYIDGIDKYDDCWIGFNDQFEEPYWFGITPDGNNAYEYNTADEILNAKVFDGKSMYELWDKVYFYSLNGVDALEWIWYNLKFYYCRKQDAYNVAKLATKLWNGDYDKLKIEFEELVQTENNRVYTAYYNEKMLAFVHCSIRSEYVEGATSEKVAYIEAIYVEEEYRKFGIATHLIELCEKWAKEQGIIQIASDCEIDNLDSIKLHFSSGFEESAKLIHFIKNI